MGGMADSGGVVVLSGCPACAYQPSHQAPRPSSPITRPTLSGNSTNQLHIPHQFRACQPTPQPPPLTRRSTSQLRPTPSQDQCADTARMLSMFSGPRQLLQEPPTRARLRPRRSGARERLRTSPTTLSSATRQAAHPSQSTLTPTHTNPHSLGFAGHLRQDHEGGSHLQDDLAVGPH